MSYCQLDHWKCISVKLNKNNLQTRKWVYSAKWPSRYRETWRHIEAGIIVIWLPFCGLHFQLYFPNWNLFRFHPVFIEIRSSGPLVTKGTDVLPQDLAKSRSLEIMAYTFPITLKFVAELPVKFHSDTIIITPILAASRLHGISRYIPPS